MSEIDRVGKHKDSFLVELKHQEGDPGGQVLLGTPSSITIMAPWNPDWGRDPHMMLPFIGAKGGLDVLSTEAGRGGLPALPHLSPHPGWR